MSTGLAVSGMRRAHCADAAQEGPTSTKCLTLAWVIAIATSMPWSGPAVAEGGTATLLKFPLLALAVLLAYAGRRRRAWPRSVKALLVYCAIAAAGGLLGPDFDVSFVRSARFSVLLVVSAWVIAGLDSRRLLMIYARAGTVFVGASLLAMLLGFNPLRSGRLYGFLPPTHPNIVGAIAGLAMIVLFVPWARGDKLVRWQGISLLLLTAGVVLSGSRTSILATAFGLCVALVQRSTRGKGVPVLYCCVLLITLNSLFGNPLHSLYTRESARGSEFIDITFTGRTERWATAIEVERTVPQTLFGKGMAVKSVPSPHAFTAEEPLDGSWVSAFVQAGLLGLAALLVGFVLFLTAGHGRLRRLRDPVLVGVVGFVVLHSIFESSLNDVSVVLPALVALGATRSSAPTDEAPTPRVPRLA
ncbi:O-antigen ligase family protein [Streptomyces sp. NBC_01320]|uniref:O-antigen ligase family protein n=1 Tax=Streptomyces sp. NBC_01320 TaxID=2903824 RepID=UPI002E12436A|nr:O-antigen ligase family protein [Streptomyces sp. NBC_01320]